MSSGETGGIVIDKGYPKTRPGILRIVQIIVGICGIICIESTDGCFWYYRGKFGFYQFVAVATFIYALVMFILFILRVQDHLARCINVPLTLVINDSIQAFLYLIAAILVFISPCGYSGHNAAAKIAGVFGLIGMLLFVYTAFLSYQDFQSGTTTRKTTVTTTVTNA